MPAPALSRREQIGFQCFEKKGIHKQFGYFLFKHPMCNKIRIGCHLLLVSITFISYIPFPNYYCLIETI